MLAVLLVKTFLTSFRNASLSLLIHTCGTFKEKSWLAGSSLQREQLASRFQRPYSPYESLCPLQNYSNEKIFFFFEEKHN